MPPRNPDGKIYSATYSNVPVYEYNVEGNHVMRRRSDDWINATHILKVADYDKPARTRILEREVQKGVHEKVQGGYGKYQGTWIPLPDGQTLAERNGVFDKLRPIFEFVPGDRSPPPAPKHATAASSKPRVPKSTVAQRRPAGKDTYANPSPNKKRKQDSVLTQSRAGQAYGHHMAADDEYRLDPSLQDGEETPDNITIASDTGYYQPADDDYDPSYYTNRSSKRRRIEQDTMTQADKEHQLWADELLDYFMLQDSEMDAIPSPPSPPANANLDRPIDDKGHTALHWAAAMGDVEVCKDLIRCGASVDAQSKTGETPLMRAVFFTNSFDKQNMERLAQNLIRTVNIQAWPTGASVFHHIAATTARKSKYACARYYTDCILNKMAEVLSPDQVSRVLDIQDGNGDTAITIAARNGARKCVRSLIGRAATVDIPNAAGETADQLIVALNARRQERSMRRDRDLSSSPFQADGASMLAHGGAVQPPTAGDISGTGIPFDPLVPHSSLANGASTTFTTNASSNDVYKSEAALMLTSQTVPTIFNKAKNLALHFEQEMNEKDAELAECERIAVQRQQGVSLLQRQIEEWRIKELEQTSGGVENDDVLAEELERLERECESLVRAEENVHLRKLIKHGFEDRAGDMDEREDQKDQDQPQKHTELLRLIRESDDRRRTLIKEIVAAFGQAGVGEKSDMYKRLITGALAIREEDIESLLPEIVSELEESRGFAMSAEIGA